MKKAKLKKLFAALLASIMVIASFSGCSDNTAKTPTVSNGNAESKAASTQPLKFKVTTVGFGEDPTGKLIQEKWLEKCSELMGRKIEPSYEFIHHMDYEQKIKIITAGGDIPDLLTYWKDTQPNFIKFGQQGLFEELTQHMDKLPNYKRILDIDTTSKRALYSDKGELFGFYNARWQPDGDNLLNGVGGIRKDVVDQLKLKLPNTIQDIYNIAKAMKAKYPDKYPIILHEEWMPVQSLYYNANKTSGDRYYNGEKFVFGPLEDSYKEAIMELSKLYKEKLISPDYFTHTSENGQASVANGDAMIVPSMWDGYPAVWGKDYPNQKWVSLPAIKNEKYGDPYVFYQGAPDEWKLNVSYCVALGAKSKCKDEMLKLMDLQYSPEIVDLLTWGIEGTTFKVVDGKKQMFEKFLNDPKEWDKVALGSCASRPGIFPQPQNVAQDQSMQKELDIWYKDEIVHTTNPKFVIKNLDKKLINPGSLITTEPLSAEESEKYSSIMTAVKTYADEQRSSFIKGDRSFNEWDKYLKEINAMGDIQACMDMYTKKVVK